ncbi:MAG: hypothetical protein RIF34_05530, partial [Candidatus Kapaibacterium sp.]
MEIVLLIVNILVLAIVFVLFKKSKNSDDENIDIDARLVEIKDAQNNATKEAREEQTINFRLNREELTNNFS